MRRDALVQTEPLPPLPPPDPWLTLQHAAAETHAHVNTLYHAIRRGELRAVRLASRGWRLRRSWVDTWLLSEGIPPAARARAKARHRAR